MPGAYEKAISIKEAIDSINNHDYLLPAIQRKFVWSSNQICLLFDSIMRDYPINTFMMWDIKKNSIKNNFKFYGFLTHFCQRFNEENPEVNTSASFKDFKAIIDGQQRLTSLYIGLYSTYAYKRPRVWWPSTEDDNLLPPRKLYLDLLQGVPEEDESRMKYNFRFLTKKQYMDSKAGTPPNYWFCLHEILRMPQAKDASQIQHEIIIPYLKKCGLAGNEFAQETLFKLYEVIHYKKLIHYFNETNQDIDHVLDVFIRTNSGGTKLDFSDLLTSIAVAQWDGDFRKELDGLTRNIYNSAEMGFYIERDLILKICLMLTGTDVRFKVGNFKSEQVKKIQKEWEGIKECIKASFLLVRRFGINPQSLISKNAVVPICYYLYKKKYNEHPLYENINNLAKCHEHRAAISQWFYMALLKQVFGGQADTILTSMRDVLKKNIKERVFPLQRIIQRYKGTNKDLRFDDAYIDSLLDIQYGEGRCRALLHLLFPEMKVTEEYHIDHLHPKSKFEKKYLIKQPFLQNDEALLNFNIDPSHWNAIPNLHLLNNSQNVSKNDRPLKEWVEDKNVHLTPKDLLVEGVDIEFYNFKDFYEKRRAALKNRLISRVFMSSPLPMEIAADELDEEIVEVAEEIIT